MRLRCRWGFHKWVSDPERPIMVDTPTAWEFPHICSHCPTKDVAKQSKSVQQVIVEQGKR